MTEFEALELFISMIAYGTIFGIVLGIYLKVANT